MVRIWDDTPFKYSEPKPIDLSTEPAPVAVPQTGLATPPPAQPAPPAAPPVDLSAEPAPVALPQTGMQSPWGTPSGPVTQQQTVPYTAAPLPRSDAERANDLTSSAYREAISVEAAQDSEYDGSGFLPGAFSTWDVLAFERLRNAAIESDVAGLAAVAGNDDYWVEAFRKNPAGVYGELLKRANEKAIEQDIRRLEADADQYVVRGEEEAWLERRQNLEDLLHTVRTADAVALGSRALDERARQLAAQFTYLMQDDNRPVFDAVLEGALSYDDRQRLQEVREAQRVLLAEPWRAKQYAELRSALPGWFIEQYLADDEELVSRLGVYDTASRLSDERAGYLEQQLRAAERDLLFRGMGKTTSAGMLSGVLVAAQAAATRDRAREFLNSDIVPAKESRKAVEAGADPLAVLAFGPEFGPMTVTKMRAQYGLDEDTAAAVLRMRGLPANATYADEQRLWSYERYLDGIYGPRPFMKLTEFIASGYRAVGVPDGLADFGATMTLMAPAIIATVASGGSAAPLLYGTTAVLTAGLVTDQYQSGYYGEGEYARIAAAVDWLTMNAQFARPVRLFEDRAAMAVAQQLAGGIGRQGFRTAAEIGVRVGVNAGIEVVEDAGAMGVVLALSGISPLSEQGREILLRTAQLSAATGAAMPLAMLGVAREFPVIAAYPVTYVAARYGMGMNEEEARAAALGAAAVVVFGRTRIGRKVAVDTMRWLDGAVQGTGPALGRAVESVVGSRPVVEVPRLPPMTIGGASEDIPVEPEVQAVGSYRGALEDEVAALTGGKTAIDIINERFEQQYGSHGARMIIDPVELWEFIDGLGLPEDSPVAVRMRMKMMELSERGDIRVGDVRDVISDMLPRVAHTVLPLETAEGEPVPAIAMRSDIEDVMEVADWAAERFPDAGFRVDGAYDVVDGAEAFTIVRMTAPDGMERYVRVDERGIAELPDTGKDAYERYARIGEDVGDTAEWDGRRGQLVVRLEDPFGLGRNGERVAIVGKANILLRTDVDSGEMAMVVREVDVSGGAVIDAGEVRKAFYDAFPMLRADVLEEIAARVPEEGVLPVASDILSRPVDQIADEGAAGELRALIAGRIGRSADIAGADARLRTQAVLARAVREAVDSGASVVQIARPDGQAGVQQRGTMTEFRAMLRELFAGTGVTVTERRVAGGERVFELRIRNEDGVVVPGIAGWVTRLRAAEEGRSIAANISAEVLRTVLPPVLLGVADYVAERLNGDEHREALVSALMVAAAAAAGTSGARIAGSLFRVSRMSESELASEMLGWPHDMEFGGDPSFRTRITNLLQTIWRPEAKASGFVERLGKEANRMTNQVAPAMGRWARAVWEAKAKGVITWDERGVIRIVTPDGEQAVPVVAVDEATGKVVAIADSETTFSHAMAKYSLYERYYGADHPFVQLMRETGQIVDRVADVLVDLGIVEAGRIRANIIEGGMYFPRGPVVRIDENGVIYREPRATQQRFGGATSFTKRATPDEVVEFEGAPSGLHPRAAAGETESYVYVEPGEALQLFMTEAYRKIGRRMLADVLLRVEDETGKKLAIPPSERVSDELRTAVAGLAAEVNSLRAKEERAAYRVMRKREVRKRLEAIENRRSARMEKLLAKVEDEKAANTERRAAAREALAQARTSLRMQRQALRKSEKDLGKAEAREATLKRMERVLERAERKLAGAEKLGAAAQEGAELRLIQSRIATARMAVSSAEPGEIIDAAVRALTPAEGEPDSAALRALRRRVQRMAKTDPGELRQKVTGLLLQEQERMPQAAAGSLFRSVARDITAVNRAIARIADIAGAQKERAVADAETELVTAKMLKEVVREAASGTAKTETEVAKLARDLGRTEAGEAIRKLNGQIHELDMEIRDIERNAGRVAGQEAEAEKKLAELRNARMEAQGRLLQLRRVLSDQMRSAMSPPPDQRIDLQEVAAYAFPVEIAAPLNRALNDPHTRLPEFVSALAVINNALRTVNATADVSFPFITGLLTTYKDPVAVGRAMVYAVRRLNDPQALGEFINAFDDRARADGLPSSGEWVARGLFLSHNTLGGELQQVDLGETVVGRAVKKIEDLPVIRQSNQMFSIVGDMLRLSEAQEMYRALHLSDAPPDVRAGMMRQIIDAVHAQTGYSERVFGDIGAGTGAVAQFVQFAGRFFQSQLNVVANAAWGVEYKNAAARQALLRMFGIGIALTVLMNDALGNETDFDPDSPNRLRVRVGGQDISLFGPWDTMLSIFVEAAKAIPGVPGDSQIIFRVRSKMSPVVGFAWDQATGETAVGDDARSWEAVVKRIAPFGLGDFTQKVMDEGIIGDWSKEKMGRLALALATSVFGVKSTPMTPYERYLAALEADGVDRTDPLAVKRWEMENWEIAREAHSEDFVRITEEHRDRLLAIDEAFRKGEIASADEWVARMREENIRYSQYFAGVEYERREPRSLKEEWLQTYRRIFDEVRDPATGIIDREKLRKAETEWIAEYGEEALQYVTEYFEAGKTGLAKEYYESMMRLRNAEVPGYGKVNYFELPRLAPGVLSGLLTEDEVFRLRDAITQYRKQNIPNASYDDAARRFLGEKALVERVLGPERAAVVYSGSNISRVFTDIDRAGMEKMENPVRKRIKELYVYDLAWFDRTATIADLEKLRAEQDRRLTGAK